MDTKDLRLAKLPIFKDDNSTTEEKARGSMIDRNPDKSQIMYYLIDQDKEFSILF